MATFVGSSSQYSRKGGEQVDKSAKEEVGEGSFSQEIQEANQ